MSTFRGWGICKPVAIWRWLLSDQHGKTSRPWEPQRYRQEAQSPDAQLPESDLPFCLLATVPRLDLRRVSAPDEDDTRGAPPCAPAMMVCRVLSAYCVGVLASRKIALACERPLAFLALVGPERPDFRTISDGRTQPLEAFTAVFVHVVRLAREAGVVQLGHVSTDGTTIQGQASRHQAMSAGEMHKAVERLREALEPWVTAAYQQDEAPAAAWGRRRGAALPAALARREDRIAQLEDALRRWEAQAQAAAEAEPARRAEAAAERRRSGQKRRGTGPTPMQEPPDATAPRSFTDPERPLLRTHHKGWEYCGNAHASVDGASQSIVACAVTDATHAKQHAAPLAQATLAILAQAGIEPPKAASGHVRVIPATLEKGSDSAEAVQALEDCGVAPYVAPGRQKPHEPDAEASAAPTTAQERRAATVRTPAGRALYARRQVIVAPVLGQSKEARGFRRFLRRGLQNTRGAWRLVCLSHHRLKLWRPWWTPMAISHAARSLEVHETAHL
jgi:transposase